jgi:hypothetical protein
MHLKAQAMNGVTAGVAMAAAVVAMAGVAMIQQRWRWQVEWATTVEQVA